MSRETAAQIERAASLWLMRIDREGRTPELVAELDAWLAGDRRRHGAWLQAESAWLLLDRLGQQETEIPETEAQIEQLPVPFSRRRLMIGGGAAIVASLAGGLFLLNRPETYATAIGEIRRVPLADGSTAAINTGSRVRVAFAAARRTVRLDRGEAWFQVARDPARPFLVEAGRVRVMAVGTAFSVRRRDGGADIMVTEGVVEAWADGAEGNRIRLAAGRRAFVADNAAIVAAPEAPSEVDRALAWRAGRIDLDGESLADAAAEFNRYNARRIVISDPALADERFHGIFRTDDPEGFAMAVRSSLEARVTLTVTEIRIGRSPL